jgi:hypothetical protein
MLGTRDGSIWLHRSKPANDLHSENWMLVRSSRPCAIDHVVRIGGRSGAGAGRVCTVAGSDEAKASDEVRRVGSGRGCKVNGKNGLRCNSRSSLELGQNERPGHLF